MNVNVKRSEINELKRLVSPPCLVKEVLFATHILLYDDIPSWKKCQMMLANPVEFLRKINEYDTSRVTPSMKEKLKPICENSELTYDRIIQVSVAASAIGEWVMQIYTSLK